MIQLSAASLRKLCVALAIYLTSLFAANTLGLKIMPFPLGLHVSVGIIMFPVVFIMTDVVGEVYGKQIARYFVLAGFVSTALFILYSFASFALPWSASGEWVRDGYSQVFGLSLRIAIASLVAYAVGEYQDVVTFFFFKQKWGNKVFWLRSFLSNLWSQLFDTVLFMVIAFAGVYETRLLVNLIISWWLFKVAMGAFYTPLSYLGIYLLRERSAPTVPTVIPASHEESRG